MRRYWAVASAAVREVAAEPLSLLLTMGGSAMPFFAGAFNFHQFGEPMRMARDATFSALMVVGGIFAAVAVVRGFCRERESGTLEMALAHPVSRAGYFMARFFGLILAYWLFFATVLMLGAMFTAGAQIGWEIASARGEIAPLWGPSMALGAAAIVLPAATAAACNRFWRLRFTLTAVVSSLCFAAAALALAAALAAAAGMPGRVLTTAARMTPVAVAIAAPTVVLAAAAAAAAVRWRAPAASAATAAAAVAMFPMWGGYYFSEALAGGGRLPWSSVGWGWLAALPLAAGCLTAGAGWFREGDAR